MTRAITFEEALQRAKARRDQAIDEARRQANRRLAEQIKYLMKMHGRGVSAAASGLGWSRPSTYELCERAGVDIKRTQNNREETDEQAT